MQRRQLWLLILCSLNIWWVGIGLMPLLPLYAGELGASPAVVGNYLSFVFFMLTIGTAASGWLAAKLQRRRGLIVAFSLVAAPAAWWMGQSTSIWQLALSNGLVWLAGGAVLALLSILAGRNAAEHERGKVFGLLALSSAAAGVAGPLITGVVAGRWGYPVLFGIVAANYLLNGLLALWLKDSKTPAQPAASGSAANARPAGLDARALGITLLLLAAANLLFGVGNAVNTMGRSLAMDAQGMGALAVTVTSAIGALVGLVIYPLSGWMSDRMSRRLLVALAYGCNALSLLAVAWAGSLTGFTFAALLSSLAGAERAVAPALLTDLVRREELDRGMAYYDAARWAGGIVGFAGAGYAVQGLGVELAMVLGALLPTVGLGLIGMLRAGRMTPMIEPPVVEPVTPLPVGQS
jgi:MFS family permease